MKTILLLLLSACACFAQYRAATFTLVDTSTNSVLLANTNINYSETYYSVEKGTRAELLVAFKLTSSTNIGTNPIVLTFARGLESPYFTNQFTVSLSAQTNALVWTNITIGVTNDNYLSFVKLTNHNAVSATNVLIKLFQKIGL